MPQTDTFIERASTFPEVSLVAILDADKEGFLRSETSLIQIIGRAARNVDGQVVMYADNITDSMKHAIYETNRRRRETEKRGPLDLEGEDLTRLILSLEEEMHEAAKDLRFENAARLPDEVNELKREIKEVAEAG